MTYSSTSWCFWSWEVSLNAIWIWSLLNVWSYIQSSYTYWFSDSAGQTSSTVWSTSDRKMDASNIFSALHASIMSSLSWKVFLNVLFKTWRKDGDFVHLQTIHCSKNCCLRSHNCFYTIKIFKIWISCMTKLKRYLF